MVVFPAASRPTMRIRISFLANSRLNSFVNVSPMPSLWPAARKAHSDSDPFLALPSPRAEATRSTPTRPDPPPGIKQRSAARESEDRVTRLPRSPKQWRAKRRRAEDPRRLEGTGVAHLVGGGSDSPRTEKATAGDGGGSGVVCF
jgi:hypothetical protein